jgi:hypothetical protein
MAMMEVGGGILGMYCIVSCKIVQFLMEEILLASIALSAW